MGHWIAYGWCGGGGKDERTEKPKTHNANKVWADWGEQSRESTTQLVSQGRSETCQVGGGGRKKK